MEDLTIGRSSEQSYSSIQKQPSLGPMPLANLVTSSSAITTHVSRIEKENVVSPLALSLFGLSEKVSGHVWDCIGVEKSDGGCIYVFEIKQEYNILDKDDEAAIKKRRDQWFPASEPLVKEIEAQMRKFENHKIKDTLFKEGVPFKNFKEVAEFLGYQFKENKGQKTLYLPDVETFKRRFEQLRCLMRPEARFEFKVFISAGVLDDIPFAEKYSENDVVISSDKEFVHDNIYHLFPMLNMVFQDCTRYREIKELLVNENNQIITKIRSLENDLNEPENVYLKVIKTAIGVRNDSLANSYTVEQYEKTFKESRLFKVMNETLWRPSGKWSHYMKKLFQNNQSPVVQELFLSAHSGLVNFFEKLQGL